MADDLTPKEWNEHLAQFDDWNRRILYAYLATFGKPPSWLDVGCGTAAMVKEARLLGIDAMGVDQIEHEKPEVQHDLEEAINLGRTFAVVSCIEVAEHIKPGKVGVFLNNITSHVMKGGHLLFSAAHPGQGGENHRLMRSAHWWRDKFYERGLTYQQEWTNRIRLAWLNVPMPMYWLVSNIQMFGL